MSRTLPHPACSGFRTCRLLAAGLLIVAPVATWAADGSAPATQPVASATQPAVAVTAQAPTQPTDGLRLPGGKVLLNFRNASLDSVLSFLSDAGGLTIITDGRIEGRVNLMNRQPMSITDALVALDSVLKERGYAAIRMGKTLKIVALDAAKKANIPVRTGSDPAAIPQTDEVITQVIPVRFADAVALKRDLSTLLPSYADLAANASTNTLILTDTSANVRRMVQIIHDLDTSVSSVTQVKVFPLKYANAGNAARLLTTIFQQDQTTTANQRGGMPAFARFAGRFGRGGFGGPGGSPTDQEAGKVQTKVTAASDDRTNIVVVSAPVDVMPVIEEVLKELDANPAQDQAVFTYPLRYADATNVQNVINALFNPTGVTGVGTTPRTGTTGNTRGTTNSSFGGTLSTGTLGGSSRGLGGTAGGLGGGRGTAASPGTPRSAATPFLPRLSATSTQTAADLAGQVYAVADADTNSVLIMTATVNFDRVKAILAEMDRALPQVLLKALLVEVTHDNNTDLGVEWSAINLPQSGSSTVYTTMGNPAAAAAAGTVPGGLVYKLVEPNVTATITALQKVGKVDVLSRPYILVGDNQMASINVGQYAPFITDTRFDNNNNPVNSISYQQIGITLNVTPHINPDGVVIMDVNPIISAIDNSTTVPISSTVNATVFSNRSASTHVAIRDGQTIVIGGLMQDQKNQTVNKVPIIGDIPVLGWLFQRNQDIITKTELLIFLTPHVAMEPERLQKMSNEERSGANLTPNAVAPGVFQEHMRGMQLGAATTPATRPATSQPAAR